MKRRASDPPEAETPATRDPRAPDAVRLAAMNILLRSETGRRSIEGPLRAAADSFADRDRRFLWTLVQETVRWRGRLDALIQPLLHRPMASLDPSVRVLLRLAACQVCVLDTIPPHAVVDEGVRLARRFAPPGAERLVNAVGRRLAADGRERWRFLGEQRKDPAAWPVTHSHPRWLVERWRRRWGDERTLAVLAWDNERAPVWLRARGGGPAPAGVPGWVPGTVRMPSTYHPMDDPDFLAGRCTAQDPGETLVGLLPPETADGMILDLCAAPGTKSSHLAERFGPERVVSMDWTRSRVQLLRETLARTGLPCAIVLATAHSAPIRIGTCAGVLCDAPCSALGVLRRRVDARWNVRETDLVRHGRQQVRLLEAAAELVRPGGWLLYSVCTTEPEETEAVREAFLSRRPQFRPLPPVVDVPAGIREAEGTIRILPGQVECDGVYASLFERVRSS